MTLIETAIDLKTKLDKLRPLTPEMEVRIMQKFRLDWNYHSNHLEGNLLTYGETKALLLFGITAQGKPLQDHIEITGHDEAIKWIIDVVKDDYPLNENFIRQLHTFLLKESYTISAITPEGYPTKRRIEIGKYKSSPNHVLTITGEIFRFASPEETPALMNDLIDWYREKSLLDQSPILLAAEFHYRFIRIHPFDDGNGRTARILMNFVLMQHGYPPVIVKTEDKENYFSALRQADSGILEPFFNYITKNLIRSLEFMIDGAEGRSIEDPDDFDKEIALLEQKVKRITDHTQIERTKAAILEVYDEVIEKVFKSFLSSGEKFNRFYVKGSLTVFMPGWANTGQYEVYLEARSIIDENTSNVDLIYNYKTFKIAGGEFDFQSLIGFEFGLFDFTIKDRNRKTIYSRKYGETITDEEIAKLVQNEMNRHKDMLDIKIKELSQH